MNAVPPPSSPFAVLLRTHFWDSFVQRQFDRLLAHASGCDVFVLVDETGGTVSGIGHKHVLRHTEQDVLNMGLPRAGEGNVLWFNGDYPLYLFIEKFPQYTHVLQLEYDVTVNLDIFPILRRMRAETIDFIGLTKDDTSSVWPWLRTCKDVYGADDILHQLICLSAFSAPALRHLFARRLAHASQLCAGSISAWPMCEAFIATELKSAGFRLAELSEFGGTAAYDHWPPYLESDLPGLEGEAFVHPVLEQKRYIASMLKYHVGLSGYVRLNSLFHRKLRRLPPSVYARAVLTSFAGKAARVVRQAQPIRQLWNRAA